MWKRLSWYVYDSHICEFQKDLIVWKLKFKDFAIRDAITVSEGLNSVETFSRFSIIPQMIEVSEGLNSVETSTTSSIVCFDS